MTRTRWRFVFAALLAGAPIYLQESRAQDLKDELDALEEPPEDDLSGLEGTATNPPNAAANAAPKADPLEDLPVDGAEKAAPQSADLDKLPAPGEDEAPPEPDAVADQSEPVGLEEEASAVSDAQSTDPNATDALTGSIPSEPAGKITSLNFKQMADRVRLVLSGDRAMDWTRHR